MFPLNGDIEQMDQLTGRLNPETAETSAAGFQIDALCTLDFA